ncbi:hypothetical protein CPC08DRAFT_681599 [Agrocybe pediades]|nr:hypothetical protein CPC08DRAFT_681599 [Agrocybe pediades]
MSNIDLVSLINADTTIKVSSTLEKATGKKNLVDNSPETCWTSQQGLPQFIQLGFGRRVLPKRLSITFQGGFVGTRCTLLVQGEGPEIKEWKVFTNVYPEDVNKRQSFDLTPHQPDLFQDGISSLKILFEASSDFFGRITIYDLKVEGIVVNE